MNRLILIALVLLLTLLGGSAALAENGYIVEKRTVDYVSGM